MTILESGEEPLQFVRIEEMALDLGDVHPRTVKRKSKTDPDFPPITVFGGRLHVTRRAWENYKQKLLARGLEARPFHSKFPPEYSATNPANRQARAAGGR